MVMSICLTQLVKKTQYLPYNKWLCQLKSNTISEVYFESPNPIKTTNGYSFNK